MILCVYLQCDPKLYVILFKDFWKSNKNYGELLNHFGMFVQMKSFFGYKSKWNLLACKLYNQKYIVFSWKILIIVR